MKDLALQILAKLPKTNKSSDGKRHFTFEFNTHGIGITTFDATLPETRVVNYHKYSFNNDWFIGASVQITEKEVFKIIQNHVK